MADDPLPAEDEAAAQLIIGRIIGRARKQMANPEEIMPLIIESAQNALDDYDENRKGSERRSMEYLRAALALIDGPASERAEIPEQPSDAMLTAARDWSYKKYGKPIGNEAAIGCWQAMRAALALARARWRQHDEGAMK